MKKKDIKLFRKGDIIVFVLVILLACALFISAFNGDDDVRLIVNADGQESVFFLDKNQTVTFESNGIPLTVTIENGYAFVQSSDCKDKICISSGKISKDGQIVVCAPANFSMKVVGNGGGYDAITG